MLDMTNKAPMISRDRGKRPTAEHVEHAIEECAEHEEMEAFARGDLTINEISRHRPQVEMMLVDQRGMVGPISDEAWSAGLEAIRDGYTLVGATVSPADGGIYSLGVKVAGCALAAPQVAPAGMDGVLARTAIAHRLVTAPTGDESSDRIADLLSMFDACAKRKCSLDLFESVEPGAQYALRLWASARHLKVTISRHDATDTRPAFAVLTVDIAPYHHHYTVTVGSEIA